MSIISDRKSIGTSILKSNTSIREDSLRKSKQIRFLVENLSSVKIILKNAEDGNSKEYMDLVYKLTLDNVPDETIIKILEESITCVQIFQIEYKLFVESLLKIKWIKRNRKIIELYHEFILNLLTAKPEYLTICTSKILSVFIPDDGDADLWENGTPSGGLKENLELVHNLVKKIMEVIPMFPVTLKKRIPELFPYNKQDWLKCAGYMYNMLKILDYCPNMMHDILETLFETLMSIDVNISRAQIEDAEDADEFDGAESESSESLNESTVKMKLPLAETLDVCMNLLFDYFYSKLSADTTTSVSDQKLIEGAIFQYFDEHILKTQNSKHVHFVFFYIASFRRSFLNDLLKSLMAKAFDRNKPPIIRQTAIGYVSSLLARAKFIPIEMLKKYLASLTNFAHEYLKVCNTVNTNLSPRAHLVFHSTCQAIFYIIAFRNKDLNLMNSTKNMKFLLSLDLSPIVKHPLNPLNYCLPAIATIFDSVMTKYQILYCHTILVKNASRKLKTVFMNDEYHPEEIIESVFPFDPYLLKKSGKRISPIYVEYEGGSEEDDISRQTSPRAQKRARNESECDDFYIVPLKKIKSDSISYD